MNDVKAVTYGIWFATANTWLFVNGVIFSTTSKQAADLQLAAVNDPQAEVREFDAM